MKLKSLHIDSYRHLENLHFDFTYPEGHAKAGKPLEKICIIGQSATGKTSLLELVRDSFAELDILNLTTDQYYKGPHENYFDLKFEGITEYFSFEKILKIKHSKIKDSNDAKKSGNDFIYKFETDNVSDFILAPIKLLHLSSEIISEETIKILNRNPLDLLNDFSNVNVKEVIQKFNLQEYIYEFVHSTSKEIWLYMLTKILNYRKKFTQMASELINKGAIGDMSKLNKQYNKWSKENENPLELFATHFNPILDKLTLEIDLVNTEYSIPIKSKLNDDVIPISSLSTGTKCLLLSMFPLFELDTKNAVILLDEPERSLFPDMQIDLISHYQNLAPEAQFVVATHSPFIAAAFEPEERFILYFDDKGKVAVRRGESPIGDDPNDILYNDFKVDYYNSFGKKAYQEYRDLKTKAYSEKDPQKKNELILEITKIGDKYNF